MKKIETVKLGSRVIEIEVETRQRRRAGLRLKWNQLQPQAEISTGTCGLEIVAMIKS